MSFNLKLYTNNSPDNMLDKTLVDIATVQATYKDGTSITDPVFLLTGVLENVKDCNYLYSAAAHRFYFVRDMISVRAGLIEFHCHVDVLSSFKDQIRNNSGIIRRAEQGAITNILINDGVFKVYQNPNVVIYDFANFTGFDYSEFVLAMAGS